jgi:hypothetical protein
VALIRTDVSEEGIASIIIVTRSSELGTLAETSNRNTVHKKVGHYRVDAQLMGSRVVLGLAIGVSWLFIRTSFVELPTRCLFYLTRNRITRVIGCLAARPSEDSVDIGSKNVLFWDIKTQFVLHISATQPSQLMLCKI